jgi:hypothetical protein
MVETVAPRAEASGDGELAALDDLVTAVEQNARDERMLARRIGQLRNGRAEGRSWHDVLDREKRPGALELSAKALGRLTESSGRLRRALARGLRAEGASIPAIAALFGVSHQRVSALLRRGGHRPPI